MEDSERLALEYMLLTADRLETTARRLLDMPWVADDISFNERHFIISLYLMNQEDGYTALSERLLNVEWIVDGVSYEEKEATRHLRSISWNSSEDSAVRLMDMPFLQTLENLDVGALESLATMSSMDALADILARPQFKDGITDDQTMIVAMWGPVLEYAPHRVDALLDPSAAPVERRMVELPLSGEVELAIVRTYRGGARRSMDLLESAVRKAEKLMDAPLPLSHTDNAVWLLFENAVRPGPAGIFAGAYIVIRPKYALDARLIAHEVAHYYWHGNPVWLAEGMAEVMASVIERERVGSRVRVTTPGCWVVKNIMELEALGNRGFLCNYSLGERLFLDLLRQLGEDAFWDGARKLYEITRTKREVGIEDVRQAFGPEADEIISRWYGE